MNNRYNYGNRRPASSGSGSTDNLGVILMILILGIIVLGILYMNLNSDINGLTNDIEELRLESEQRQKTIDSLIAPKPVIVVPKKEEPVKPLRKRVEKDTSKHVQEKPKDIPQPITIQDTAR
jgi:hypothetical protein